MRAPSSPSTTSFAQRASPAQMPEWMDDPCEYATLRDCLRDLGQVNRVTLAYRPVLHFLRSMASSHGSDHEQPLRIVDVGSGGGDTLRAMERWATRRRIAVELTGIDLNPHAARAAREFSPASSRIRWVTADALEHTLGMAVDVVTCSLMTHHLENEQIVHLLRWMDRVAVRGWCINDLRRSRTNFILFRTLATVARWHPFVRHDGPVSIRRSFCEDDWQRLLQQAGIACKSDTLQRWFPGRLCVSRCR